MQNDSNIKLSVVTNPLRFVPKMSLRLQKHRIIELIQHCQSPYFQLKIEGLRIRIASSIRVCVQLFGNVNSVWETFIMMKSI